METSPHTRGEPPQGNLAAYGVGNIPAYAGRTFCSYSISRIFWKHPRIRGENPVVNSAVGAARETSPHTRGELAVSVTTISHLGNIPAYAGRTWNSRSSRQLCWKHPRIRGENRSVAKAEFSVAETSPHTRGEQTFFFFVPNRLGNIPAYAGRTKVSQAYGYDIRKHPRIRGENPLMHLGLSLISETSPHTRGEHPRSATQRRFFRNIPAYAGRTHP